MDVYSTDTLLRLMSATALRSRVLASNIANQNTPGYHRRDVRFEKELLEAIERPGVDISRISPEIYEDLDAPNTGDDNTVTLEQEVGLSKENRLLFEVYTAILSGRFSLIRSAIVGGR